MEEHTPKQQFKNLIELGFDENRASELSGWHPIDGWEDNFIGLVKLIAICAICMGFIALADAADAHPMLKRSEDALVACVNGGNIRIGDEWFFCTKVGKV